ncbi:MAG: hypothetical protein ACTMKV_00675 [Sphingomonas parapaucimobilis]
MASRRRMTRAAAALPNSSTIGGAGTGVGGGVTPPEDEALLAEEALDAEDALEAELADEPFDDQPLLLDA